MQERVCVYIYIYNGGYTCSTRQHVRLVSDYSRFHEAVPLYFFFFNLLFIYLFIYVCMFTIFLSVWKVTGVYSTKLLN